MSLPDNRTLNTADLTAYTPSCGSSPAAAYIRAPFRCRLLKVTGILGGAITTADGVVTVTVNSAQVASFGVPQAGSAAGQLFSAVPASPTYLNADDVIALAPSGASGTSVPMHFSVALQGA